MTCIILRHQPDALVLKLRFFDDRKREFPGKSEISGPHYGQKWGPEAVEPSFSPGKTAEKKRNFKTRQRGPSHQAIGCSNSWSRCCPRRTSNRSSSACSPNCKPPRTALI